MAAAATTQTLDAGEMTANVSGAIPSGDKGGTPRGGGQQLDAGEELGGDELDSILGRNDPPEEPKASDKPTKSEQTPPEKDKPAVKGPPKKEDKAEEAEEPEFGADLLDDDEKAKKHAEKAKGVTEPEDEDDETDKESGDLSGVDKVFEEVYSKKMSKDAVDFTRARLKELKVIKSQLEDSQKVLETERKRYGELEERSKGTRLPDSYYEHSEAYKFSPEFKKLSDRASELDLATDFYTQQLAAVRGNKKWRNLVQDPKTGQLMIDSTELEPGPEVEARLMRQIGSLDSQLNLNRQAQDKLAGSFKEAKGKLEQFVGKVGERFFPEYLELNEKHPEHGSLKQLEEKLPPELKSMPLWPLVGKSYLKIRKLYAELSKLQKANSMKKVNDKVETQAVRRRETKSAVDSGRRASQGDVVDEEVDKHFQTLMS